MLTCSICLEELSDCTIKLECGHSFHAQCSSSWFRHGHAECPSCRNVPAEFVREPPGDREQLGIVTESTLNDLAESLYERFDELDDDVKLVVKRFFRIRARLRRLRAVSSFLLITTRRCRPGTMSIRRKRCQHYAEEAIYYEEELSELGAELLARTDQDDDTSDDATASSAGSDMSVDDEL